MIAQKFINRIPPILAKPSVTKFVSDIDDTEKTYFIETLITRCYNKLDNRAIDVTLNRMIFNPYQDVIFRFNDTLMYKDKEMDVVVSIRVAYTHWYIISDGVHGTYELEYTARTTMGQEWEIEEDKYKNPEAYMGVSIVSVD